MNEEQFINEIDASLPYNETERCEELILESIEISDNAAFMVLHEICRCPKTVNISKQQLSKLIAIWDKHVSHPLKKEIIYAGKLLIAQQGLSSDEVINLLDKVSYYKGQYNALAIVYFAYDGCNFDLIDEKFDEIHGKWKII